MKVLFVHDHRFLVDLESNIYSSGQFPYKVWKRYLNFFDEVNVLSRSGTVTKSECSSLDSADGPQVNFHFVPDITTPLGMAKNFPVVLKTIKSHLNQVDAVIARTSLLGNIAAYLAGLNDKPYAIEVVGCSWDAYWNYGKLSGKIVAPFTYFLARRCIKKSDFTLYVTNNFLQKRYPAYGTTTNVSNVELLDVAESTLLKRKARINENNPKHVFGIIGSLESKYKGIQTALAAFSQIRDKMPDFELQVLGGGNPDYWTQMASRLGLEENVRFIGLLPSGHAVYNWLDGVDVYLQPSLNEGLPRALIEALSRGCPAIGSSAGGIPELLERDVLHKPGDFKHLATLILQSVDKEWKEKHCCKNFETSKHYLKEVLDERRNYFWKSFADSLQPPC